MINSTIHDIFNQTWPLILISTIVLVSIRVTYIFKNKKELILYKELLMLLFILYIMCLFYIVTYQDDYYLTSSNFIPFKEMFRYTFGSNLFIKQVIGNVLMFMPFGFFLGYLLKLDRLKTSIVISTITSITIEITQKNIGRVFDIDDIILNVIGGTLGCLIYIMLYKFRDKLPRFLKNIFIYNIVVISALIGLIYYLIRIVGLG